MFLFKQKKGKGGECGYVFWNQVLEECPSGL